MNEWYKHCHICKCDIKEEESTRVSVRMENPVFHHDIEQTILYVCQKCHPKLKEAFGNALKSVKEDRESEEYWMS